MALAIDHVIIAVRDLDLAAKRFEDSFGLVSVAGGRHPRHGTGNRIIPMAGSYVELMAVVDRPEAEQSPMGRRVLDLTRIGDRPAALCLRTDDLASVCARLGLEALPMERTTPDGRVLSWHLAGLGQMLGPESLPFFIEWHVTPGDHPATAVVDHPGGAAAIERVDIGGDPERIAEWLGTAHLPVDVVPGPAGVRAVEVSIGGRRLVIE